MFVDIRSDTVNIDETLIEELAITDKARAIVAGTLRWRRLVKWMSSPGWRISIICSLSRMPPGVMSRTKGRALRDDRLHLAVLASMSQNYTAGGEGGATLNQIVR